MYDLNFILILPSLDAIPTGEQDKDTVSKANSSREKAEKSGKKGSGPPEKGEWSCGKCCRKVDARTRGVLKE